MAWAYIGLGRRANEGPANLLCRSGLILSGALPRPPAGAEAGTAAGRGATCAWGWRQPKSQLQSGPPRPRGLRGRFASRRRAAPVFGWRGGGSAAARVGVVCAGVRSCSAGSCHAVALRAGARRHWALCSGGFDAGDILLKSMHWAVGVLVRCLGAQCYRGAAAAAHPPRCPGGFVLVTHISRYVAGASDEPCRTRMDACMTAHTFKTSTDSGRGVPDFTAYSARDAAAAALKQSRAYAIAHL